MNTKWLCFLMVVAFATSTLCVTSSARKLLGLADLVGAFENLLQASNKPIDGVAQTIFSGGLGPRLDDLTKPKIGIHGGFLTEHSFWWQYNKRPRQLRRCVCAHDRKNKNKNNKSKLSTVCNFSNLCLVYLFTMSCFLFRYIMRVFSHFLLPSKCVFLLCNKITVS